MLQQVVTNDKFLECHPADSLTQNNRTFLELFVTPSHTYSSEQDQFLKELKTHSSHANKTVT